MRAVRQFVLAVVGHLRILVVEEVILQRCPYLLRELIAGSERKQRGHVVARAGTVLIGSGVGTQRTFHRVTDAFSHCNCIFSRQGTCNHQFSQRLLNKFCRIERSLQTVGLVLGLYLCAELIACGQREGTLVECQAYQRGEAPALLVDVERETGKISRGGVVRIDVAAIVAVVVISTYASRSRKAVEHLIGEVKLSAIDILFALHFRIKFVGRNHRGEAVSSIMQALRQRGDGAAQQHVEHGHALLIFHESAASHDADHRREGPAVLLVRGEESRHDGCRGLTLILLAI